MNSEVLDSMVSMAMDIMRNACVNEGNVPVGACVMASDGTIYGGCSVEVSVARLSIPAEIVAMVKAITDGKREFDAIAIIADMERPYIPDGQSLQFLAEFKVPEIIMADMNGNVETATLEELLPFEQKRRENKPSNMFLEEEENSDY